jgi:hypothetical protein
LVQRRSCLIDSIIDLRKKIQCKALPFALNQEKNFNDQQGQESLLAIFN